MAHAFNAIALSSPKVWNCYNNARAIALFCPEKDILVTLPVKSHQFFRLLYELHITGVLTYSVRNKNTYQEPDPATSGKRLQMFTPPKAWDDFVLQHKMTSIIPFPQFSFTLLNSHNLARHLSQEKCVLMPQLKSILLSSIGWTNR